MYSAALTLHECLRAAPVVLEHRPVVKVLQVWKHSDQPLPVVPDLVDNGVALQVEAAQVRHVSKHLENLHVLDLVALHVEHRYRGAAPQVGQGLHGGEPARTRGERYKRLRRQSSLCDTAE